MVTLGGGFDGLSSSGALAGADIEVTLIDKHNHHLFQPSLYQMATAALAPDIAIPMRWVLAKARNIRVLMAEVTGIDTPNAVGWSSSSATPCRTTSPSWRLARPTTISVVPSANPCSSSEDDRGCANHPRRSWSPTDDCFTRARSA